MIRRKLATWLRKLADQKALGGLAQRLEVDHSTLWRWSKREELPDVSVDTLEKIWNVLRPSVPLWQFVREVETEADPVSSETQENRILRHWNTLFAENPRRAERVLVNMIAQDDLQLTDMISLVVHEILKRGPDQAVPEVVRILHDYAQPRTPTLKRLAQKYERETEGLFDE